MTEEELELILRLIPIATVRQAEIILGQINIHLVLEFKDDRYEKLLQELT